MPKAGTLTRTATLFRRSDEEVEVGQPINK